MKSTKLNDFKEVLRSGMIENFEKHGYLTPLVFFYKDDQPLMSVIPPEYLQSQEGKEILGDMIKSFCAQPNVFAAGIIIEANAAKLDSECEKCKRILKGEIKVSELNDKLDIILMIFSTPEGEEMIVYEVDCENHKVGAKFGEEDNNIKSIGGRFSKFFNWNLN